MKIKNYRFSHTLALLCGLALIIGAFFVLAASYRRGESPSQILWVSKKVAAAAPFSTVRSFLTENAQLGEPFGIAVKNEEIYYSDGENGKIWRISNYKDFSLVTDKFDTPSSIAFDKDGWLIVVDSGTHAVKRVNVTNGAVENVAGVENQKGYADGDAAAALFDAPIGVAVAGGKIYVADTYNDKIRIIENGKVSTLAGSERGFADDENGLSARFDTPCGIAILKNGNLLVADAGNKRLRLVALNGETTTFAGREATEEEQKPNDEKLNLDGQLLDARFVEPLAVATDKTGVIYIADGNSIRTIGKNNQNLVETISDTKRGFIDGAMKTARFNRPSGLFTDEKGNLFVADSENQAVRVFTGTDLGAETTAEQVENRRMTAQDFRKLQPPRWCFDPPNAARDIAGTLGEVRGFVSDGARSWFHNGLDVSGQFGETANFVRSEKVLRPIATQNFNKTGETLRLPTMGYIHINIGRTHDRQIFKDNRFQFSYDESKRITGVRVPRGVKFEAGDRIGTLNSLSHVHLIAGRSGAEMNALDALTLPDVNDTIAPTIQIVAFFDENWQPIAEARNENEHIKLSGKTRIVVRAFDQMSELRYRKLGVYKLGYQILDADKTPLGDINWTIFFSRLPDEDAVKFVYAPGSQSGYSPRTVFNYIVSNEIHDGITRENFFDAAQLKPGDYTLRFYAADYFGHQTLRDVDFNSPGN